MELLTAAWDALASIGTTIVGLGILGTLGTIVWRSIQESRQQKRERRGLLTLLDLETDRNKRQLEAYEDDPTWITRAPADTLSTKVWGETRAKLSYLLEKAEFADLLKHYNAAEVVNSFRLNTAEDTKHRQDTVQNGLPQLKEQADKARAVVRKYVPADALHGTPLDNITLNPDSRRWGTRKQEKQLQSRWRRMFGRTKERA